MCTARPDVSPGDVNVSHDGGQTWRIGNLNRIFNAVHFSDDLHGTIVACRD